MVDQLLPKKPLQKPAERAKDIEAVIDWMRNNKIPLEELPSIPPMTKHPQKSATLRSPQDRLKDLEDKSSTNIYCTGVPIDWNEAVSHVTLYQTLRADSRLGSCQTLSPLPGHFNEDLPRHSIRCQQGSRLCQVRHFTNSRN